LNSGIFKFTAATIMTDHKTIDDFFLEPVWGREDKELAQVVIMKLLDAYVSVLSDYLGLSFRDTYHLSREDGYHSISSFIDTAYRLKQYVNDKDSNPNVVVEKEYKKSFTEFFSEKTVQQPLGISRVLRVSLSNTMLNSLGLLPIFDIIDQEADRKSLEEDDLSLEPLEKYWQLKYKLIDRLPNIIKQYLKVIWNRFKQVGRVDAVHIGYLNLDSKYMFQLPDIRWTPLEVDPKKCFIQLPIEKRKDIYDCLHKGFLKNVKEITEWTVIAGISKVPDSFIELMLAFIVLKSEAMMFHKESVHQVINKYEESLKKLNLDALYSEGGWFRFYNVFIAIAARRLRLQLMEFQAGGRLMYETENMPFTEADFELDWANLYELNKKGRVQRRQVASPDLSVTTEYKKRKSMIQYRILYSPVSLSNIYSIENTHSLSAMDMKRHRQWVVGIISESEELLEKNNSVLYIKIKGFGYTLIKGHESMLFPQINLRKVPVRYIRTGVSQQYYDYMDLHIFCSPSTTFAVSMTRNIPSICLWDKSCYTPKSTYKKLFEEMIDVGIIVRDSNELNKVFNHRIRTDEWWSSKVQVVRNKFCDVMAYSSNDWVSINNKAILDVIH